MAERVVRGIPASPGIAAGRARLLDAGLDVESGGATVPDPERPGEADRAQAALATAAAEIDRVAERLRDEGRDDEAEIVATGGLLATDPAVGGSVRQAVLERGLDAGAAILEATAAAAETLAALEDPMLAARADDLRSVGRRAARIAAGAAAGAGRGPADGADEGDPDGVVLIATDLGPADVAELGGEVSGIALAAGAVTAHAAIIARSLGLPMAIGLGVEITRAAEGETVVVDGGEGSATLSPDRSRFAAALEAVAARERQRERVAAERSLPAVTADGHRVVVLANVASAVEVRVALDAGAEGVGLLRTELAFLDAGAWPSEDQHRHALGPILEAIGDRVATVRVLDFGGDKSPPFLRAADARGIELLLDEEGALEAQLRAILEAGARTRLRVLLPMVARPDQVRAARTALSRSAETVGIGEPPPLGAMIETTEAVARVVEIGAVSDFLSIGTNDLAASVLGRDRFAPGRLAAHEPSVLRAIGRVAQAAATADLTVEVCGEAASEPLVTPILIGLGIDELSVGAARVGATRAQVRASDAGAARELADHTLQAADAADVEALAAASLGDDTTAARG